LSSTLLMKAEEIDGQQCQERAEPDQHREGLAEVLIREAEEPLYQQQMPGRRHRSERGQPFGHAEGERLHQIEPREGHGWLRGAAGADGVGREVARNIVDAILSDSAALVSRPRLLRIGKPAGRLKIHRPPAPAHGLLTRPVCPVWNE
jgi:hypothetical protein